MQENSCVSRKKATPTKALPQSAIFSESVDKAVPVDRGGLQTDHNITELHGAECRYDSF